MMQPHKEPLPVMSLSVITHHTKCSVLALFFSTEPIRRPTQVFYLHLYHSIKTALFTAVHSAPTASLKKGTMFIQESN